ncbi:MAG: cupredoxin domain-containing protein [SAR202 cluster bacterium]|nr:cupredoxin domain-containing protein [SAR202 cluster bacterium]
MNTKLASLIAMLMVIGLLAAACGGGEPEDIDIPVTITEGKMSPETIKVKQGDTVTLQIDADVPGEFHLHTYDIESDIPGGETADFLFVADATGRFKITYHPQAEMDNHGGLFESEELKPGDTFSYEVADHQAGETVPFHSHLRPALAGSIIVSQEPGQTATVEIRYSDTVAEPHEVNVGPGTVITWVNNSSEPQTVISGLHADMVMADGMADGMAMEDQQHQEDEHQDEAAEIEVGFLEVQPR